MPSSPPYRVQFNGPAIDQYRAVLFQFAVADREQEVRRAARQIIQLLAAVPLGVGDPMYNLRGMRMRVRHIVVPPLYMEYGVHETEPKVFVRHVSATKLPSELS